MGKSKQQLLVIVALLLFAFAGDRAWAQERFPRPTGFVSDFAGIISAPAERLITDMARDVKAKTGAEIAVVTIGTTEGRDIEEYAVDLFMAWGIGEEGKDNGVLLLVAFDDRQLWIKTGYGLEGAIPDAEAHRIYRDILLPGFRTGQQDQALVTATSELAKLILAESGQSLALSDTAAYRRMLLRSTREQAAEASRRRLIFGLLVPIFLVIVMRIVAARRGYGRRYGGFFWMGGFGGSSGGFGGGFGGFGGGSAGGGGAGGGW